MSWNLKDLQESLLIGSTLVEGSTLTESEARAVLAGKTIQGHPISETREILNYRAAVEWLIEAFQSSPYLSQDLILSFHARLFQGFPGEQGRWKSARNYTYQTDGSRYDYEAPSRVPECMRLWIDRFNQEKQALEQGAEFGAELYYEFQRVHPFEDGNGRIGRILIAYWFHWKWQKSFSFYLSDKVEHLQALECANRGDLAPLTAFIEKKTR